VAGREPLLEQQSEGQPVYLGASRLRLRRRRAPITATRPTGTVTHHTDIPPIGILLTDIQAMDTQPTHSRTMDIQAIPAHPVTSVPRPTDTRATRATRLTRVRRAMNITAMRGTPLIPVHRAMDHWATWDTLLTRVPRATNIRAARLILPSRVPVPDIPSMAIPAITPLKAGRPGPSTQSSLIAEL